MKNISKKPHFTLRLTHPTKHFSLCIVWDGEVVHPITNLMSFSKAIGYPDLTQKVFGNKSDMAKDAALPTEFKEADFSKDTDTNIVDVAVDACCHA